MDYTTREMLQALEQRKPIHRFLTNFFPTHNFHVAELLEIDVKKGKRKLAPFVAPRINGEIMEREGFTTHSLRTPKIAPERPMTIDDIVKRGFGENIYSTKTPEERAAGRATTKTAQESAEALGYMALAGWSVDDSVSGLMPILKLSEATQADLATTSDLVTDSMSALGLEVSDLQKYLDTATVANNKSNQTAQMLMEAYIGVGGTFNRLGTPLNESSALLGVLANRGIKASEAGNSLNSVLVNLTKKSGESYTAMKELGIEAYDSEGKFKGITKVLKEVNEKTSGLTDEQRDLYLQMIGGKSQLTALSALMSGLNTVNSEGISELDALSQQLLDTDGALNTMADTINNTMSGAMAIFGSAVDDFKITLIKDIEPFITPFIRKIADIIPNISEKIGIATSDFREKVGAFQEIFTNSFDKSFDGLDIIVNNSDQTAQMFIEAYTSIEKTLNKLETPLNESSALISVLANSGIKASDAGDKLNSILVNLTNKSGKSAEAMQELGIEAYDTNGIFKGATNVLKELNEATVSLSNEQKNSYLNMIAGEAGVSTLTSLMSALNNVNEEGVNELDALSQQLLNTDGALNGIFNTINKNKISNILGIDFSGIDSIKDKFDDIKTTFGKFGTLGQLFDSSIFEGLNRSERLDKEKGIANILGVTPSEISTMLGNIEKIKSNVGSVISDIKESFSSTFGDISEIVSGVFGKVSDTILSNSGNIIELFSIVSENFKNNIEVFKEFGGKIKSHIMDKLEGLGGFYDRVIAPELGDFISGFSELLVNIRPIVEFLNEVLLGGLPEIISFVSSELGVMIDFVANIFASFLEILNGVIEFLNGVFTGDFNKAFEGIKKIASGAFNFIASIVENTTNSIIGVINTIIGAVNTAVEKIPVIGDKLGKIPQIKEVDLTYKESSGIVGAALPDTSNISIITAANGAIATSPTLALIAEAGESEAVIPLSKLDTMLSDASSNSNTSLSELNDILNGVADETISDIYNNIETPIEFNYNPNITINGNANRQDVETALKINKTQVQQMFNDCMEYWQRRQKRVSFSRI